MRRKCKVELVGGLGNQIFGLALGKYIEQMFDFEVEFLKSSDNKKNRDHDQTFKGITVFGMTVTTEIPKLSDRVRLRGAGYGFGTILNSAHERHFDFTSFRPRRGMVIRGYFQTLDAISSISKDLNHSIEPLVPTDEISQSAQNLDFSESSACIHMRFGDYKEIQGVGVLPTSYFIDACQKLVDLQPSIVNFVIFTNDTDHAEVIRRHLASHFTSKNFEIFDPSGKVRAIESLIFMSNFHSIVLANSTFSFWGAIAGRPNKQVIYPEPWFINSGIPTPEKPDSWLACQSYISGPKAESEIS